MAVYRIIGGDGQIYSEVSSEQLRQWILEGRANGQTQAQAESNDEWRALGSFPEFAEALAAQAARAGPPPPLAAPAPTLGAEDSYSARAGYLDIGACLTRGWDLLTRHFWLLVGASGLMLVLHVALEFVPVVGQIVSVALSMVLWGGLDWLFLKIIRGEPAEFGDAFAGFQQHFPQLLLAGVVSSVLIMVGLFLCVIPGVYLIVCWAGFGPLLIMDKKLEFWAALELSRRVVTRNFWVLLALFLVVTALVIAGVLALGVGVFVTLPLATGAVVYAYEDIFGGEDEMRP